MHGIFQRADVRMMDDGQGKVFIFAPSAVSFFGEKAEKDSLRGIKGRLAYAVTFD